MAIVIINGIYQHYKNKRLYRVVNDAKHTETDEELIIYEPLYEDYSNGNTCYLWARPREMFKDVVEYEGEMVDRFKLLGRWRS